MDALQRLQPLRARLEGVARVSAAKARSGGKADVQEEARTIL